MKTLKTFLIATIIGIMPTFAQSEDHGLKDIFPFKFGNILNSNTSNNTKMKNLVLKEFNSITPENELKPNATIVLNGSTNDNIKVQLNQGARRILKFCEDNNIALRGHTLVWHSQTSAGFFRVNFSNNGALVDKETMNMRMESYIKNIFALIKKDYPNLNLYAYDVVNEGFENWGGGLRPASESPWTAIYGSDEYIVNAFTYARKYAPENCKLFYNDYNEYETNKCNSIYNLAMKLKEDNLIDGIGMQAHLDLPNSPHSVSAFGNALKKFASTGLEVQITELDITIPTNLHGADNKPTVANYEAQGKKYKDIMNEVLKYKDQVTAFVVWGIQDNQSWRSNRFPVLFDVNGNKKIAYDEIFALGTPPTSNIEMQSGNPLKAWVNDGQLNLTGVTIGKPWRVYTSTGVLVHQGVSLSETATATLNTPGVYIIWTESGTVKVAF